MSEEYEIINARVRNPQDSLFKSKDDNHAKCIMIKCKNKDNCPMFGNDTCAEATILHSMSCPYGKFETETGPSSRSKKLSGWIDDKKEEHKDVLNKMRTPHAKMCIVGDYVYLPYAHLSKNQNLILDQYESFFVTGSRFMHRKFFGVNSIMSIIEFKPFSMSGDEITSYQKDIVPKFLIHLNEEMPELFDEVMKRKPEVADIIQTVDVIGRVAYVKTLRPGCKIATVNGDWTWDGEHLINEDYKMTLALTKYNKCSVKMDVSSDATIKVTDLNQVTEDTKYAE